MSVVNVARNIKQIHPNDLALIKVGKFYHVYGKDAYVISYLFNYQLKKVENNTNSAGFPEQSLNKVLKTLEDKSISYLLIERSSNYDVVDSYDFKDKNCYLALFNKALKYINRKSKVDTIYEYLINSLDDDLVMEQIKRIEETIYE